MTQKWVELARQELARREAGISPDEAWQAVLHQPDLPLPPDASDNTHQFANNKIFTAEKVYAARARLKRMLRNQDAATHSPGMPVRIALEALQASAKTADKSEHGPSG